MTGEYGGEEGEEGEAGRELADFEVGLQDRGGHRRRRKRWTVEMKGLAILEIFPVFILELVGDSVLSASYYYLIANHILQLSE